RWDKATSVGGHSGRKCGGGSARAFWFNHLVQSFSSSNTGSDPDRRGQKLSCSVKAGHPVRRGLSIQSLPSLEYWVARSSRAMTTEYASAFSRRDAPEAGLRLSPDEARGLIEERGGEKPLPRFLECDGRQDDFSPRVPGRRTT